MTHPMTSILTVLLTLATMTGAATPQSKRFYEPSGKSIGTHVLD